MRLHPVASSIDGGLWAERRRFNREVLIPDGERRLKEAGNFDNLRAAAGLTDDEYKGRVYQDSDLHKWLEAVGHELAHAPDPELQRMAEETTTLLEAAQDEDGYLDTAYQVPHRERWSNLAWDHELYCMGHLIEAAVAQPGNARLHTVARRLADHLVDVFGDRWGTCGHPEIELALIALYRQTGERSYLALAQRFLDRRGHEGLQPALWGSAYFQDRVPVREQTEVEGHAVRALYLAAGAADLYLETGEPQLLAALLAQWQDMADGKTYITGGVGSDPSQEAFGAPYDLPPDRAYTETCAAIASVMFNWRLLLATGEVRFADLLERTLYNGVLVGVARDSSEYAYENPLHVRDRYPRKPWYECACCPPNVMRTLASLPRYFATRDDSGVQIHQYASGTFGGVRVDTDYPWDGRIEVESDEPVQLRVPAWSTNATLNGAPVEPGYVTTRGRAVLDLDLAPRLTLPDPRIAAVRGCAAIERGPLVYCVEGEVEDVELTGPPTAKTHDTIEAPGAGEAIPYAFCGNRGDQGMRVWIPRAC